jgi:hypothetical protein
VGNTNEATFLYNYTAQAWNSNIGISAVGNVAGGNIRTTGLISATGNLTAGNVSATNLTGTLATAAQTNITSVGTLSTLSASGNVTGGNVLTAGIVSATGNITGNFILGNGSQLSGIITSVANINSGTSNVTVVSSGGNVTVGVGGTSNVAVFATTGEYVTGVVSASGNVTGGNLLTGGIVSSTGNITGGNIRTAGVISSTGNITGGNVGATLLSGTTVSATANVVGGNITTVGIITATGNITGGNISATNHTGTTVSVTGNVTGGNITTPGLISATGNITTANSFVGNLVGTTVSVTGNVTAGNVSADSITVNGQPTTYGVVTPVIVSNTSPNLSSFSNGTSTSPATTVFTLSIPSAGTWQLESWIRTFSTTGTPLISGGFYTGGTLVANSETLLWPTPVTNANGAGYMSATVTTTGAATYTVGLWSTATGIGLYSDSAGRTKATATSLSPSIAVQATATGTVATNYAKYTRTASQSVSANSVIVCNVAESSSGTAVSVNTSTGQVTLTAGTYRLRGTAGTTVGSLAASLIGYGWYNETTSAWVGEGAGWVSPSSTNYNVSTSGTAEYVITVASTTVVSLRVIDVTGVTSIGGNQSDFAGTYANPWIDIEQIGATFALNALDTMTTTGNVSVGGNLTVTGNITGNIATQTTGSWTVTAGAGTYSLTVPINGTYSIWVRGNIPSGIVSYTATVVVTNTNVPVLGSSYGWYYVDGNQLVLTSMPTQIIGTVNNISTASISTTTANVFTFGITNNSGTSQVVNYGYTKL